MSACRYAVLHHTGIASPHFDFLFENAPGDDLLTTFRCPRWPLEVGDAVEELEEHRRAYLEYEGPVSGDRGFIARVDAGAIEPRTLAVDPPLFALSLRSDVRSLEVEMTLSEIGATTSWVVARLSQKSLR